MVGVLLRKLTKHEKLRQLVLIEVQKLLMLNLSLMNRRLRVWMLQLGWPMIMDQPINSASVKGRHNLKNCHWKNVQHGWGEPLQVNLRSAYMKRVNVPLLAYPIFGKHFIYINRKLTSWRSFQYHWHANLMLLCC